MNPRAQPLTLAGPAGAIEALLDLPEADLFDAPRGTAVIAHPHPLFGGAMNNALAICRNWSSGTVNGFRRLVESDIAFNMDHGWANHPAPGSNLFDVQTVMTHEAGHTLGLADVDWRQAPATPVMHFTLNRGERRQTLSTTGDVVGLGALNYR